MDRPVLNDPLPQHPHALRPQQPGSSHEAHALQASAGNRAAAALLKGRGVQRHTGASEPGEALSPNPEGGGGGGTTTATSEGTGTTTAAGGGGGTGTTTAEGTGTTTAGGTGTTTAEGTGTGATAGGSGTTTGAEAAEASGPDYNALATRIRDAIEGLGTDEDAVYAALGECGRDPAKIERLKGAYQTLTGRSLEADIQDDFSGAELDRAMSLMSAPNRQEQIEAVMRQTAAGRWALSVIEDHGVTVVWDFDGTGSYHQAGTIYLNKTLPPDAAANVMCHEAQHALTFKTGQSANVMTLDRQAFVDACIADEAEAVMRQIEAVTESGGSPPAESGLTADLMARYQAAHTAAVDAIRAANPDIGADELAAQARTRVRDGEITTWFHDGTFVTSTVNAAGEHPTYSDHYGSFWDSVRNPPAPTPTIPPSPEPGPPIPAGG